MATMNWVNIGSGNGLLKVALLHQAITWTWTNVGISSVKSCGIIVWGQLIPHEITQPSITKIILKIIHLKFHWNTTGANEFIGDNG